MVDSTARAASLQAITAALGRALTVEDVAQIIIELGLPGLGADAGAVAMLSASGGSLDLIRAIGYPYEMVVALQSMELGTSTPMTEAVRGQAPAWRDADIDSERFADYARENTGFAAGAGLPLLIDDRVVGAIGLSFAASRTFSETERSFMLAVASQCAQAIERVQLYQAERSARAAAERAAARTARLQTLTAVLSQSVSTDGWAAAALGEAIDAVGADRGLVYLLNVDGDALELIHAANVEPPASTPPGPIPLLPGLPVADAVLQSRPICIDSPFDGVAPYPNSEGARPSATQAWAYLPLVVGGRAIGAMSLAFRSPFDHDDVAFMQTVAAQCAQALERARLVERERAGHEEAALLHAVAASAAGQSELSGILTAALDHVGLVIPFTGGSLALVEGNDLVIRAAQGPFTKQALGQRLPRSAHVAWRIVETGQPFLSNDRLAEASGATTPIRAFLGVPLAWEERRFGLLEVDSTEPGVFTSQHLELLRKVGLTVSRSVELARLYAAERAAREQLDAILAGVADGVIVQGNDHRFIYANEPAARIAGFSSAVEYLGAHPADISARLTVLDENGQPFPYDELPAQRALRGEASPEMVVQFRRGDTGEVHWSLTRARAIRGPDGELLAISIFHDITERIRSEERLRFLAEAGAYLAGSLDVKETLSAIARLATETLADWAVVYLVEGDDIEEAGVAHRDPTKAALVDEFRRRYPPRPSQDSRFWQAIKTGQTVAIPEISIDALENVTTDPAYMPLVRAMGLTSALYIPLVARGRTLGALGIFTAESGRRFSDQDRAIAEEIGRRAALALDNARLYRESQNAIRARDEFLSIASHELRTPVTAISGIAQLLQRSRSRGLLDDERLDRALVQITQGSARLAALTEDLLDVSRLQTGHFDLRPVAMDVQLFLTDVIERTSAHLGGDGQHRIDLVSSVGQGQVEADPARLEQVIANLLSNAIKYSPEGGSITVGLTNDGGGVRVDVTDEGIGVPADSVETIFQPFGRGPNAAARQIQGLGLGLYICREIVRRHSGRIWAESRGENQGTTFHVWLPFPGAVGKSA
ncbi:MAG TPA: GAF domain-containing protein [Chloroflexota bacterium]|nr:GAF domain-containing protein [Chloroflexota bacterium]